MQKLVLSVLCLILFACGNKPADKKEKNTQYTVEKTSIEFKEKVHDFGRLKAGEIVLFTFEYTNTGLHNYEIESIQSDCACVTTYFKKGAVKPGEKGIIEVEFNTAGLVGKEFKTIEIYGNSKELKHLAIFAQVKNDLLDIKN